MSKDCTIPIRISSADKEKALKLVELLHKKSIAALFRDIVIDLYSAYDMSQNLFSIDELIQDLEQDLEYRKIIKAPAIEIYSVRTKISMLKELKEEKGL